MLTHRAEHAERKFRAPSQQLDEFRLRHQQDRRFFHRAGVGWVSLFGGERRFRERFDRAEEMNHLFFPRRADPVDIDRSLLDDVKTKRAVALAEKIIPLREMFRNSQARDLFDVAGGKADEKRAAPERVFDDRAPNLLASSAMGRATRAPLNRRAKNT